MKSQTLIFLVFLFAHAMSTPPSWSLVEDTGNRPSRRGAPRLEVVGGKLIMFAGFEECFDINAGCDHIWYNDVWSFDLGDNTWTQASPTSVNGELPQGRAFFGSAKYALTDSIMYFGGVKYNILFNSITFYGDLWQYFPATDTFVKRIQQGAVGPSGEIGPGSRAGTALAIDGHTMYAVAGIDGTGSFTYRNDVWAYDLRTDTWRILSQDRSGVEGVDVPAVRYLASVALHKRSFTNELIVYGGNAEPTGSGNQNQDTWKFNLNTNSWSKINSIPGDNVGRTHGAFALFQETFFIALGDRKDDTQACRTNEVSGGQLATNGSWILDLNSANPSYCEDHVLAPPRLKRVGFAQQASKMFIWGGFDFDCQAATAIWNTNVYSLPLSRVETDC
jgi:hypothetical protein